MGGAWIDFSGSTSNVGVCKLLTINENVVRKCWEALNSIRRHPRLGTAEKPRWIGSISLSSTHLGTTTTSSRNFYVLRPRTVCLRRRILLTQGRKPSPRSTRALLRERLTKMAPLSTIGEQIHLQKLATRYAFIFESTRRRQLLPCAIPLLRRSNNEHSGARETKSAYRR
jgi:hypothetical protein